MYQYLEMNKKTDEELKAFSNEEIQERYNQIKNQVQEEYLGVKDSLEVATDINRFRAFTAGTRSPFFVRYSGKAVMVNPLTGVIISGGKYARVQDLKTFMSKMITPSQIKYIATLSEMIGAHQLKEGPGIPSWMIIAIILLASILFMVYGLPMLGVKLF